MNNIKRIRDVRRELIINPFNAEVKKKENGSIRPELCAKWDEGDKEVLAIGINPSVATNGVSDKTMTTLCRFVDMYGFNYVKMLNIFESVSTQQDGIDKQTPTDFNKHIEDLNKADLILIAWGVSGYESEKEHIISILKQFNEKVYCIAKKRNKRYSYPIHPSRMTYACEIIKFNI